MSVRSAALQATCAALGFVLTMQSATAALHHAHKHHRGQVISQWRPWDANAAVLQIQPRGSTFAPNSAEVDAVQKRITIFNATQAVLDTWFDKKLTICRGC
jgi:hypothetical protein